MVALQLGLGQGQTGSRPGQRCLRARQLRLVGARIDGEQQLTGPDHLAFAKVDDVDGSGYARAHFNVFDGLNAAGKFIHSVTGRSITEATETAGPGGAAAGTRLAWLVNDTVAAATRIAAPTVTAVTLRTSWGEMAFMRTLLRSKQIYPSVSAAGSNKMVVNPAIP